MNLSKKYFVIGVSLLMIVGNGLLLFTDTEKNARSLDTVEIMGSSRRTTYYVYANATGASDSNDGLSKNYTGGNHGPWATLSHAIDNTGANDTVLVYDGIYSNSNSWQFEFDGGGTENAPKVFRAMTGNHLIDAANNDIGVLFNGAQHIVFEGFKVKGASTTGIDASKSDNITLRNNTLWNAKMGMNIVSSRDVLVENSTSYGNSEHGIYISGGGTQTSSWCTVRNNTFYGNGWSGVQLRTGSNSDDPYIHHCIVENNTIYENGWDGAAGITLSHVRYSVVRNNLLYDNVASGFVVWGGGGFIGPRNVTIVSNTVYFQPGEGWSAFNMKNGCRNITIKNTILVGGGGTAFRYTNESLQGLEMDNNIFYRHGSSSVIYNESSSTSYNLSEWRNVEPSYNSHSIEADPSDVFVDENSDDLHLREGSPAIDSGDSSIEEIPEKDLEGNPRIDDPNTTNTGTGPREYYDIGALEYVPESEIVHVRRGWNFISLPWLNTSSHVEDALSSVSWDKAMLHHDGGWRTYVPSRPSCYNMGFPMINNTEGIWVHAAEEGNLSGYPYLDSTKDIELEPGWNMVGYPSGTDRKANETLPNEVTKIGVFDSNDEYNIRYIFDLSTYTMTTGEGYWVYNGADHPVTWTVDY